MRLNARWYNFARRGQAWDRFWQDAPPVPRYGVPLFMFSTPAWVRGAKTLWWGM